MRTNYITNNITNYITTKRIYYITNYITTNYITTKRIYYITNYITNYITTKRIYSIRFSWLPLSSKNSGVKRIHFISGSENPLLRT